MLQNTDAWDNRACVVVAVLAKHYKVEMTEGPEKGTVHKYLHKDVTSAAPLAETATGEAATGAAPAATTNAAPAGAATGEAATGEAATDGTGEASGVAANGDWSNFSFS